MTAAEQAAVDLETSFHASTNVVMDLEPTTSSYLERPEDETAKEKQLAELGQVSGREESLEFFRHLGHRLAEPTAALIVSLAGEYSHIVAPATTDAKNVLPRVAALKDVAQLSEIIAVESAAAIFV